MIRNLLNSSSVRLLPLMLVVCAASAFAGEAPKEALPVKVFEQLRQGKNQTVVVYGTSLSINGQWAKALGSWFEKEFPGKVAFHNSAKAGMHSNWGVENLEKRVLAKNPDLVFIEFSANDAATKHRISLEKSVANLDHMVKALRRHHPQVDIVLQTMNPAWDSPANPAKKYGSDRPDLEAYNDMVRRYAHERALPLVDHYPNWLKMRKDSPEEFQKAVPDGIHPHGGSSMAVTWPAVRDLLERTRAVVNPAAAQPAAVMVADLWPAGNMPGKGSREPETHARPERADATRITHVSRPTLSVFPAPEKNSPALIVCPGGGYSYVVVDKEGSEIAAWLNANGYGALVLKYRTPNNRAGALQDVQRALSLARSRAEEWRIDPKRLGVIGFSAGGNLAAKSSTLFETRSYPAIDAVDRQSCRPDFAVLVYPAYLDDKAGRVSPDLNLKADIPPTLIVHSEDDKPHVPGSKLYAAALAEAKHPHQFLLYPTGGHGYALRCERAAKAWPDDALKWLDLQTRQARPPAP